MDVRRLSSESELQQYRDWVNNHPNGNLWQSPERREYLDALGQENRLYAVFENNRILASALVVIDTTSFGLSTWDLPRGPLWTDDAALAALASHIVADARQSGCLALYASPITPLPSDNPLQTASPRHIHCEATLLISLDQSDDELLAQMKPKGRYNIRVADKHGIEIRPSSDVSAFFSLVQETSTRDGFTGLSQAKYEAFVTSQPGSFLLYAYHDNTPVAGLIGVVWGDTGIYYYGASSYEHRALMAPYALQWAAMQHCKAQGAKYYDLLGIAPPEAAADHPWQGITSFKEKFGGELVQYPPEQMLVLRPLTQTLLTIKRKLLR